MANRIMQKLSSLYGKSREEKLEKFRTLCELSEGCTVVDVGVNPNNTNVFENMIEQRLSTQYAITAVTLDTPSPLKNVYPAVRFVQGDGCNLPFADNAFDAAFSNAVVEHVGDGSQQSRFVEEIVRVAKRGFLTTPNYWFPFELHSSLPFVQFLPWSIRRHLFRIVHGEEGMKYMRHVHLLSARKFRKLFPKNVKVRVLKQRITFWPETLIAVFGEKS